VDGSEFLQRLDVPRPRDRAFRSPERLPGIVGSIGEPETTFLIGSIADHLRRNAV